MQAVILAAGMGKRLGELTQNNTKCMVKVNGVTLIERLLQQLDNIKACKLERIVIVTGYEGQKLRDYIATRNVKTPVEYVDNPIYATTNNIYSLWLAKDYLLKDDTLLFESDLIFDASVVEKLLNNPYPSLALVSKYESWMDGTVVKLGENCEIDKFIPGTEFRYEECHSYYKTVNIYKFSREFSTSHYVPFLEAYSKALGNNEYYEQVLRVITLLDKPEIKALPLEGESWYEIDDVQDLDIAESIFCAPEEKLERIESRKGGYWRYPKMLDFCTPVNHLFPNERLMSELRANFDNLVRSYPSGMRVNSLLAGKYFGVRQEYICVGNGAAELIKMLMDSVSGTLGVIVPTFEEYMHRVSPERLVPMEIGSGNFSYTADDVMAFFADKKISNLLLVNPDNPSGNFIPLADILRLCAWAAERGIKLVIDESFVDFAEGDSSHTLLENSILEANPHVVVLRSISKSHGVPGVRLGVLATADVNLIARFKQETALWNINSLGEFYMQIFGKYEKHYRRACVQFVAERKALAEALAAVPFLRVVPGQANFLLCEVQPPFTSRQLAQRLLEDYDILVKDCSVLSCMEGSSYIRVSVRSAAENAKLVNALQSLAK